MADVTEIDYTTDPPTVTERAFTAEEKAQREADAAAAVAAAQAAAEEAARKEAARASAVAKLAALGLDADEVEAILGGTA